MKYSSADAPFAWTSLEGDEIELPSSIPTDGSDFFATKEITNPLVRISICRTGIWIIDSQTCRTNRIIHFTADFPSYSSKYSNYGNSLRVAIAPNGSVAFHCESRLYYWDFATSQIHFIAELEREPEAMALSPASRRLAILSQMSIGRWFGWVAWVWELPNGHLLGKLRWKNQYIGSLTDFTFFPDGSGLCIETDVNAQSGSDFTENGYMTLEQGPEG